MSLWCGFRREKIPKLFLLTYAMARVVALLVVLLRIINAYRGLVIVLRFPVSGLKK